jgi:hypothetical protein
MAGLASLSDFARDFGGLRQSHAAHKTAIAKLGAERIDYAGASAIIKEEPSGQIGQLRDDFTRQTDRKFADSKLRHYSAVSALIARVSALEDWSQRLDSRILSYFTAIFEAFRSKRFRLLWRGSRDGFTPYDFHSKCDGHASTITVIEDTTGAVFGGFTPVAPESSGQWNGKSNGRDNCLKGDPSGMNFLKFINSRRTSA